MKVTNPELFQPQQQQPEAQQPTPQAQPEAPYVTPTPGSDPRIAEELNRSPALRSALEAEVKQIEQAKAAYAKAAEDAVKISAASFFTAFPELSGMSREQLPVAVQLMQRTNPQRAAQIIEHAKTVQGLYTQSENIRQQQEQQTQRQHAQQFEQFAEASDAAFERAVANENPDLVRQVSPKWPTLPRKFTGSIRSRWWNYSVQTK